MNNKERSIKMKKWILIVLLFTGCSADHQAQEAVVQTQVKVDFSKMHFGCDGNSITAVISGQKRLLIYLVLPLIIMLR